MSDSRQRKTKSPRSEVGKTNLFPEHFVFLISDDIKEDHIRCCLIVGREKRNPLGAKLVVKLKTRDLLYGKTKRGQTGCVVLPNLLKDKATVSLSVAGTYRFTRKYPFT